MRNFIKDITIRRFYILKILWDKKGSYFDKTGWINSFKARRPLDQDGKPVPWLSIGANRFLEDRLTQEMEVLEYGSGNSTLYLSDRVKSVHSIEYNQEWVNILKKDISDNVDLKFVELGENQDYQNANELFKTKKFDIIFIDGRRRLKCLESCLSTLHPSGVVVFDDTQRDKYKECFNFMKKEGFKQVGFWGMATGSIVYKNTTIFYRSNNCLEI